MDKARIAELLEPFLGPANDSSEPAPSRAKGLTTNDLAGISTYIDILLRWNARINLTSIRKEEDIVTRHFGESLFAARHLFPNRAISLAAQRRKSTPRPERSRMGASRGLPPWTEPAPEGRTNLHPAEVPEESYRSAVSRYSRESPKPQTPEGQANGQRRATNDRISLADIGSGAGFPGIPIKLWAPQILLTLVESNHKKATFLREVARALTLTDINIQIARAEDLLEPRQPQKEPEQNFRPPFNVVTIRAVECFRDILPAAGALVAPAGRLALLIGSSQQAQAEACLPSFHWLSPTPVPLSKSRILLIGAREPRK